MTGYNLVNYYDVEFLNNNDIALRKKVIPKNTVRMMVDLYHCSKACINHISAHQVRICNAMPLILIGKLASITTH